MTPTTVCDKPIAGGEYMESTGPYVLLSLGPGQPLFELPVDSAERLRDQLGAAIREANRLRHAAATVPLRFSGGSS